MNLLTFIETSIFQKDIKELLSDDEYREFQNYLNLDPTVGDIIVGTGGCRKVRWTLKGKGKSGGIRVIYYYLTKKGRVYFLVVYPKSKRDNLTNAEKNQLKQIIDNIEG